jgi:hypothetical protein
MDGRAGLLDGLNFYSCALAPVFFICRNMSLPFGGISAVRIPRGF